MKMKSSVVFKSAFWCGAVVLSLFVTISLGLKFAANTSDWAACLQAWGATVGIATAVWVPIKQRRESEDAEERNRKDEMRRICLAFRDEISLLKDNFANTNVNRLLEVPDGEIFNWRIAVPQNRFPIFTAMVGRITAIDDEEIRRGIIELYEAAHGLMDAGQLNNQLLIDYRELVRVPAGQILAGMNMGERELSLNGLRGTCVAMQALARRAIAACDKVLPLLIRETQ